MKKMVISSALAALLLFGAAPVSACPCEQAYALTHGMENTISDASNQGKTKKNQNAVRSDAGRGRKSVEDRRYESRVDRKYGGPVER